MLVRDIIDCAASFEPVCVMSNLPWTSVLYYYTSPLIVVLYIITRINTPAVATALATRMIRMAKTATLKKIVGQP